MIYVILALFSFAVIDTIIEHIPEGRKVRSRIDGE